MPNYALILRAPCEGGVPVRLFKVCVSSTNTTPPTSKPGPERGAYSIITPAGPYCAEARLTPAMRQEIITDHEITIPLRDRLFSHSDWLRSLVRNLGSTIALLCMWCLPFMGERRFALGLAVLILPYFVFGAALGYGPASRYDVAVQPLILMLATTGVMGMLTLIRQHFPKSGAS